MSCQKSLIKSEDLLGLVEVVIRILEGFVDNKVLQLGIMLLDNLLRMDFKFEVRPETRVK